MNTKTKYIIWIKDKLEFKYGEPEHYPDNWNPAWVEQGDGPLTQKQASRISREIGHLVHSLKILPVGNKP